MSAYEPTGQEEYEEQPGTAVSGLHESRRTRWYRRLRRMGSEASLSFVRGLGTTASGLVAGLIVVWAQR
ncbi:hypothetical protein ACFVZE_34825 [Streptomyces anulatus]|uniref:hypothetical protein n=1 Tax=Streptomyces anulatus TaxID=1892 RepID=UPI002F90A68D|nr:hypothetical protein OG865_40260 [Streptomyces anulatus]